MALENALKNAISGRFGLENKRFELFKGFRIYDSTMGDSFLGKALYRFMSMLSIEYEFGGAGGAFVGGYFYDIRFSYSLPFLPRFNLVISVIALWMVTPS
jgi:hypothetical protein